MIGHGHHRRCTGNDPGHSFTMELPLLGERREDSQSNDLTWHQEKLQMLGQWRPSMTPERQGKSQTNYGILACPFSFRCHGQNVLAPMGISFEDPVKL